MARVEAIRSEIHRLIRAVLFRRGTLLLESGEEPYRVLSWRNYFDGDAGPQKASL